jgi:hypothetical protein
MRTVLRCYKLREIERGTLAVNSLRRLLSFTAMDERRYQLAREPCWRRREVN